MEYKEKLEQALLNSGFPYRKVELEGRDEDHFFFKIWVVDDEDSDLYHIIDLDSGEFTIRRITAEEKKFMEDTHELFLETLKIGGELFEGRLSPEEFAEIVRKRRK